MGLLKSLFGLDSWDYVANIKLKFFGMPTPHLKVAYSEYKKKKVPRWITKQRIACGNGDINTVYLKGKTFRYKIEYYIPKENWHGNPQTAHQVFDDYMVENSFFDFELAEDVKEFVTENKDVKFQDLKLKEKLFSFDNSVLLKVTKTINSPTMIIELTQVDEDFIKENY